MQQNPIQKMQVTVTEAKRTGSRCGMLAALTGIIIAQLIMASLNSAAGFDFFWFMEFDYKLNLVTGIVILFLCGNFYGQWAGKAILIFKKDATTYGLMCSIASLLTTGMFSGLMGFFEEGIANEGAGYDSINDYIVKPLFWITIFGIIPAILTGIGLGALIKHTGDRK